MDRDTFTIHRVGFGFTEDLSFWDFAENVIQDAEEALRIGANLADYGGEYPWNEEQPPSYYEEFSLVLQDSRRYLRAQMDDYRIAKEISEPS